MRWKVYEPLKYYNWFAWYPVKVGKQWVWLERVWFRYLQGTYFKEYYLERPQNDKP